jgi:salicylate hydroxylase
MGLEDGVVLGMVLSDARTVEEIEEALDLYESIRRGRASAIQILSNVGQDQTHLVRDELKQYIEEKKIPSRISRAWLS